MRIGLLLCDHLDPDKAGIDGDYPELFRARFGAVGLDLDVVEVTRGELPASPASAEGWMISGSRHSTYDDLPWIRGLVGFIREAHAVEAPMVGICFGHQLIADALGGRTERAEVGWGLGVQRFELLDRPVGLEKDVTGFSLLMSHRDQVTALPEGATRIATSDYCPNAGYTIGRHVLCVQGHPEFTPALAGAIYSSRRELIGGAHVDEALRTLDGVDDGPLVAEWMAAHLREAAR